MLKQSLHASRTKRGDDHNVFQRNGFVMAILTVLMVLMRIPQFIIVLLPHRVPMISLHARMDVASTRDGLAITITIVATVQMKENSAIHNTKHAHLKSLHVKTSNVSELNIVVMAKMIAAIIQTKLDVRKRTIRALLDSLHVTMDNVLTLIWSATKYQIALMTLMNRFIVMSMNALKLRSTNVVTNALIRQQAITAIVIKDINCSPTEKLALTSMNALRLREFVRNIVPIHQADIIANAMKDITRGKMMSTLANEKTTKSNRGYFSQINIM